MISVWTVPISPCRFVCSFFLLYYIFRIHWNHNSLLSSEQKLTRCNHRVEYWMFKYCYCVCCMVFGVHVTPSKYWRDECCSSKAVNDSVWVSAQTVFRIISWHVAYEKQFLSLITFRFKCGMWNIELWKGTRISQHSEIDCRLTYISTFFEWRLISPAQGNFNNPDFSSILTIYCLKYPQNIQKYLIFS